MTELRCADVEARFVDAIDGRLDSADSVRFHAHIEGCAACRERAALWRGLVPGMRDAVPPAPGAMATRRMQIEVERRLASGIAAAPARGWRWRWAPAFGLVAAAAVVALWLRVGYQPAAPVGYAAIGGLRGSVAISGDLITRAVRVPVGAPIRVAAGASVEVALDSGAELVMEGPGLFILGGSARNVAVRLAQGKLRAEVDHRQPDQTFAVITKDLRVEVRGTKFSVAATAVGSRVEVTEGQVAIQFVDGRSTLVSAGGSADSNVVERPPDEVPAPVATDQETPARPPAAACADVARSCQATARAIRASMRGGGSERALRLIGEARREMRGADARCEGSTDACEDELRYLNAEALNQGGRLDDAVAAYRALDRRGAPEAMRQNALYAAAQIERRQGRTAAAAADFERALAAAPRGALYEDALVGAMESARAAGAGARARALATRYLQEFPRGLAAPAARRLAGDGAP